MIHVKSKHYKSLDDCHCAVLADPDLLGLVKNDEELYEAIRKHGSATLLTFNDQDPLKIGGRKTITANEFCEQWRGD